VRANTLTGFNFEEKVDFLGLAKGIQGYKVRNSVTKAGSEVCFNGKLVVGAFKKTNVSERCA